MLPQVAPPWWRFGVEVPGNYILVDHALSRAEKGLAGIDGRSKDRPDLYKGTWTGGATQATKPNWRRIAPPLSLRGVLAGKADGKACRHKVFSYQVSRNAKPVWH